MKGEAKIQLPPNIIYDALQIHPKVKKVTESLFKNGHYPQAILEAFKLIDLEVRKKSGLSDRDGADLMHHVFDENKPILHINSLKTLSEKDEQHGFRFIFAGAMTGVRNPKAHEIVKLRDSNIALEYIAFASLLMKILDKAKKAA